MLLLKKIFWFVVNYHCGFQVNFAQLGQVFVADIKLIIVGA